MGEGRKFFFFWRTYTLCSVCVERKFLLFASIVIENERTDRDQTWLLVGKEGSWSSKRRDWFIEFFFFFLQFFLQHYSLTLDNLLQFVITFTLFETKVLLASSSSPPALTSSRLCYCSNACKYTTLGNVRRLDAGEAGKVGYRLKRVAAGIRGGEGKKETRRGVISAAPETTCFSLLLIKMKMNG